jgi:hypothetical protein
VPPPQDPECGRLAADMDYLDSFWAESPGELFDTDFEERLRRRVRYVRSDGTYNPANGHFWCDDCYIALGMPLGRCP